MVGCSKSPLRWNVVNLLVKYLLPIRHTVFYEDFIEDHEKIFSAIADPQHGAISGHSLAGNPSRFGDQTIEATVAKRGFHRRTSLYQGSWLAI